MEYAGEPDHIRVRALLDGDAGKARAHERLLPANQHFIRITIPNGIAKEIFQPAAHPGWDGQDEAICNAFGAAWHAEARSALLIVPSLPARMERNFLINPTHPEAAGITHELPEPAWWDARLYR